MYKAEGSFNSARSFTWPDSSLGHISSAHQAFFFAITGDISRDSDTQNAAWKWYFHFLKCKIREAWVPLFRPILKNIDEYSYTPRDDDIATGMRVLTAIVSELQRSNVTLVDIIDGLYNQDLLKDVDVDRSTAYQMVFVAFGWISKHHHIFTKELAFPNYVQFYRHPLYSKNRC